MTVCNSCVYKNSCTKTFGMLAGYCNTDGMTREDLENAVIDLVSHDMEVVFTYSDDEIRQTAKDATDDQLLEFWQDAKDNGLV